MGITIGKKFFSHQDIEEGKSVLSLHSIFDVFGAVVSDDGLSVGVSLNTEETKGIKDFKIEAWSSTNPPRLGNFGNMEVIAYKIPTGEHQVLDTHIWTIRQLIK
jgi:hypothetical protein